MAWIWWPFSHEPAPLAPDQRLTHGPGKRKRKPRRRGKR